jgi:hypothetical protein
VPEREGYLGRFFHRLDNVKERDVLPWCLVSVFSANTSQQRSNNSNAYLPTAITLTGVLFLLRILQGMCAAHGYISTWKGFISR